MKILAPCIAGLVLFPVLALSQGGPPFRSDDPDTPGNGHWEINLGFIGQRSPFGGSYDTPNIDINYGVGSRIQLKYEVPLSIQETRGDSVHVAAGLGNSLLGLKYRFFQQTKYRPSTGVFYQAKVPSASVVLGLGSGQVDHAISFLISKEIHPIHVDFNVTPVFAGRGGSLGFDRNVGFALSAAAPLSRRFGAVIEGYGYTALNDSDPGFAATMVGFTWQVRPRLILDTGLDVGVTAGAPQRRVFVGLTYAIANVYSWMRPQH